jgi:hypothetical protein
MKIDTIIFDGRSILLLSILKSVAKGYKIDRHGVVTAPRGNVLKAVPNKRTGYLEVMLPGVKVPEGRKYSSSVRVPVHKFQAFMKFGESAFQGNTTHVRHKNTISDDNRWDNLILGTATDNARDDPPETRSAKARNGGLSLSP